uniref:Inositol monophosphatase n=1 Tax=candidate division CPR3 bacterium TaxID=2268181 RepID=A0A7V3J9Y8_UNCC3
MNNLKEGEEVKVDFPEQALQSFLEINQLAVTLVNEWRSGLHNVFTKTNANGVTDVITEVDRGIERLAIDTLQKIAPDVGVFGEENFKYDFSTTLNPQYFVVDPIDGTKEFVRGSSEWSISLCLVENGKPTAASVYMPDKQHLFTAVSGKGAKFNGIRLQPKNDNPKRIGVSPRQIKEELFRTAIDDSGFEPIMISALTPKICALLRGEVDAAVYFPQEGQSAALWDYAASVLLVSEAGGQITSLCGNELPFVGEGVIHKKGWLATRFPSDHSRLLSCLKI